MNIGFINKTGVRKKATLATLALLLSISLVPEKVTARTSVNYPQVRAGLELNPGMIALVPIPHRKPEVEIAAKERYSVFKGLSSFIGFDLDQGKSGGVKVLPKRMSVSSVVSMGAKGASLSREVRGKIRSGQPVAALTFFRNSPVRKSLTLVEHDLIQSQIAAGFLYNGKIQSAGKLAAQSAQRSGKDVPMAGWIAGLSLWQQEEYAQAATYFEIAAASPKASTWMAAGAAYWASRAHERAGDNRARMVALQKAAQYPRTFYGLMAVQALGLAFDFNWEAPAFDDAQEAVLKSNVTGARALKLVRQGDSLGAEKELLSIAGTGDASLRGAMLALAEHVGMPKLSLRLGNRALQTDGEYYDAALYPVSPWEPENGFSVDPALVHAVMRQESKFDITARSASGAMGLMQIMPTTANYVARNNAYKGVDLQSPKGNLKIGQDYLKYLLKDKNVNGDLMMLLVAYNAGPGNLAKWKTAVNGSDDPLLFIEMVPVHETREYVEHVMVNYWMYRLRDGKDLPTLRATSRGEPAQYAQYAQGSVYEGAYKLAMAGR